MKITASLVLVLTLALAGCGSDDDSEDAISEETTTTSTAASTDDGESKSHTEATSEELEEWQTDLNAVGCYAGAVDGTKGPQTEAAIKAFQTSEGLTVDGLLGPQTESALTSAVADGRTVCTDTTDGDAPTDSGSAAELTSANYDNSFTIAECTSGNETSIEVTGEVNGLSLAVTATAGTGTLTVDGGTETDGITLNGDVSEVQVGDTGDFTVTGTFTEPNNVGEEFTLTGSCA